MRSITQISHQGRIISQSSSRPWSNLSCLRVSGKPDKCICLMNRIWEIRLDAKLWHGSFNGRESTLQQLAPYVGKLKSGIAQGISRPLLHAW